MARNGSGTFTPIINFTTEAGSPPIQISKLDEQFTDVADALTGSIAANGETNPTADLKMNGFKHTNVGAATALTQYGRVAELIDQDHVFYVDSGSANTYAITPSPAITAYEEGQRFVFRAANSSSGASTLNVNGLGATAIQTNDGSALVAGSIVSGGYYEVTYDANTTPDRWVLTSPSSKMPDGMLSSNVALKNSTNSWSAHQVPTGNATYNLGGTSNRWATVFTTSVSDGDDELLGSSGTNVVLGGGTTWTGLNASNLELITDNGSAAELGYKGTPTNIQNGDYTLALSDAGKTILKGGGGSGETITIPANASVAFPLGTQLDIVNRGGGNLSLAITSDTLILAGTSSTGTRTIADNGWAVLKKTTATEWLVGGSGVS